MDVLFEMHQEKLLDILLSKLEVVVAVRVCIVFFSEALWEAHRNKKSSDLYVFSYMRQAVADLGNICWGLIMENLLERKSKLLLTLIE